VLYPETFSSTLILSKGKLRWYLMRTLGILMSLLLLIWISNELALPTFSSSDIKVLGRLCGRNCQGPGRREGNVLQVPKCPDPSLWQALEREFSCLQTIVQSPPSSSIRVPKPPGLVSRTETGKLVGILADNIPHAPDKASTLQAIAEEISAIMELRRKRWFCSDPRNC
jgi:hypothetical protein